MVHQHGEHADWSDQLAMLEREGAVTQPWVRDAVSWLVGLAGQPIRQVVDVGAGPGFAACVFAEAVGNAQVVALDPSQALLDRARSRALERGVGDRLTVRLGRIGDDLDDLGPADLVWCARVAHHLPDPQAGLREIARLVSRTGLLAVVEGGLAMRFLPGGYGVARPGFVSRLDAVASDLAIDRWGLSEKAYRGTQDWPMIMAAAGLTHLRSRSFVLDLPAPLDEQARAYVVGRFADIGHAQLDQLSPGDATALTRLLDPTDPAALVNRADLFILAAYTLHVATPA
jgi:SAM-dependent methyltransferase